VEKHQLKGRNRKHQQKGRRRKEISQKKGRGGGKNTTAGRGNQSITNNLTAKGSRDCTGKTKSGLEASLGLEEKGGEKGEKSIMREEEDLKSV